MGEGTIPHSEKRQAMEFVMKKINKSIFEIHLSQLGYMIKENLNEL